MNRYLRYAVAAAFAAGSLATSVAHAIEELEGAAGNNSIANAQKLDIVNGGAEITGSLGATTTSVSVTNDLDFFYFDATTDSLITVDIDGAMKQMPAPGMRSLDTVIAIYASDGTLLRTSDDVEGELDAGSEASNDSLIVDFVPPFNGRFYVAVGSTSAVPGGIVRTWVDGGVMDSTTVDEFTGNGGYTLVVSGVVPYVPPVDPGPVGGGGGTPTDPGETPTDPGGNPTPPSGPTAVNIDIRPRHAGVAKVYPHADGRISVAILSTSTFNAMKVDKYSLKFGAEGNELSYVGCWKDGIDVNRDGRKDLVCRFDLRKASFDVGDLEGILTGTAEGSQIKGAAPLKVVMKGKKRKHQHHHYGRDHNHRGHGDWHSNRGRDRD
jgi:hypothetical protein